MNAVKGDAALDYAARGWLTFPCHWIDSNGHCSCRKADCGTPGKHPFGRLVPRGHNDATTDADTIRSWWKECPEANVAVRTGVDSGIFVIDLDVRPEHDGRQTLAALEEENGRLPETVEQISGSGSQHIILRHPGPGIKIKCGDSVLGPGVDIKGDGGYIIVEPSNHWSGGTYRWDADHHPDRMEPAAASAWLLARLSDENVDTESSDPEPDAPPAVTRWEILADPQRFKVSRHQQLRAESLRLLAKGLPIAEVRIIILALAAQHGLLPDRAAEIESLVVSAVEKLKREGRRIATDDGVEQPIWVPSTLAGVVDEKVAEVPYVVEGLIPKGEVTLVVATWKTGKTLIIYELVLAAIRAGRVFGRFRVAAPVRVVVFQLEMPSREDERRFRRLALGRGMYPAEIPEYVRSGQLTVYNRVSLDLTDSGCIARFHETVRKHEAELVIIDSVLAAIGGDEDLIKSNAKVRQLFSDALSPLTSEGRAIVALHHKRKKISGGRADEDDRHAMLGAQAWGAGAGRIYSLERLKTTLKVSPKEMACVSDECGGSLPEVEGVFRERLKALGFACRLSLTGSWTPEDFSDVVLKVRDTPDGGTAVEALTERQELEGGGVNARQRTAMALAKLVRLRQRISRQDAFAILEAEENIKKRTFDGAVSYAKAKRWVDLVSTEGGKKNEKDLVSGDSEDEL